MNCSQARSPRLSFSCLILTNHFPGGDSDRVSQNPYQFPNFIREEVTLNMEEDKIIIRQVLNHTPFVPYYKGILL